MALAVAVGLLVGKTAGITGAALLAQRLRIGPMPHGVTSRHLWGRQPWRHRVTGSLFVADLAYAGQALTDQARVAVAHTRPVTTPSIRVRSSPSLRRRLGAVVAVVFVTVVSGGCGDDNRPGLLPADGRAAPASPTASASPAGAASSMAKSPTASGAGRTGASNPPVGAERVATLPAAPAGLPLVIRSGPPDRRRVALTFDADMTPAMLRRLQSGTVPSYYNAALIDELRRRSVPATLFLTGLWMQEYPDVTRELAADPLFELGTHTWQHLAFTKDCYGLPRADPSQMLQEVLRAQRLLDELAGERSTRLFRFPGGCYDAAALRAIEPAGVTVVQFDVEGGDGFQPRAAPVVRAVVAGTRNGSIVVLHMNGANTSPRTAEAVGPIAEQLRAQGYTLTTVSELFAPENEPSTPRDDPRLQPEQ